MMIYVLKLCSFDLGIEMFLIRVCDVRWGNWRCFLLGFEFDIDVDAGKEEIDEGFQEAAARSTCWYQWGTSR